MFRSKAKTPGQSATRGCCLGSARLTAGLIVAATLLGFKVLAPETRRCYAAAGGPGRTALSELKSGAGVLSVAEFLPPNYVTDGSVSYQQHLQRAIDAAARSGRTLIFPAMTYRLDDPTGLQLRSGLTLVMYGAVFLLDRAMERDGQAFFGRDVTAVTLLGGEVAGQREHWPDSVNVAGVRIVGRAARVRIRDMVIHDVSSNAIGIFGNGPDQMIEHVWIDNVLARDCCNKYIDYLLPGTGPAKGSDRKDQGAVAMYFVENFLVAGCSFERSRSDGTHFYRCRRGRFANNVVSGSTMGGYFIEWCEQVLAANNLIVANGSRGVTIEAGSRHCTLTGNVIEGSGREGLWAPDSIGLIVTGNIFRHNGRKDHGQLDGEIMINESGWDPSKTPRAENYRIANNIFITTARQGAAIRVLPKSADIVIEHNTFRGPVRTILVADSPEVQNVLVQNNAGAQCRTIAP